MSLCVLDISEALTDHRVHWLPGESSGNSGGSPEEAVLYSIVHGRGEIIVFGGVQKFIATQATTNTPGNGGPNIVSNAVYFIKAPKPIIWWNVIPFVSQSLPNSPEKKIDRLNDE